MKSASFGNLSLDKTIDSRQSPGVRVKNRHSTTKKAREGELTADFQVSVASVVGESLVRQHEIIFVTPHQRRLKHRKPRVNGPASRSLNEVYDIVMQWRAQRVEISMSSHFGILGV